MKVLSSFKNQFFNLKLISFYHLTAFDLIASPLSIELFEFTTGLIIVSKNIGELLVVDRNRWGVIPMGE